VASAAYGVVFFDLCHSLLVDLFKDGDFFGSLLRVPEGVISADPGAGQAAPAAVPLVRQARLLADNYDCVVTNPPYLSSRFMGSSLRNFAKKHYPHSRADLCSMFMERCLEFSRPGGVVAMLTMHSWMFLPSYRRLREKVLDSCAILSVLHLGARAFETISGEVVQAAAFVMLKGSRAENQISFFDLRRGDAHEKRVLLLCGSLRACA